MRLNLVVLSLLVFMFSEVSLAEGSKGKSRKTQQVNFDGSDIDGVVRSPDGAYLVQKRGVKFMPLYKVKTQFDINIKDSIEYLR